MQGPPSGNTTGSDVKAPVKWGVGRTQPGGLRDAPPRGRVALLASRFWVSNGRENPVRQVGRLGHES